MNNNTNINPSVNNNVNPNINNGTTMVNSQVQRPVSNTPQVPNNKKVVKKKKSHGLLIFLLILIIAGMGYYIYTDYIKDMKNKCSPLITGKNNQHSLDLDSTIVKDLYQKVKTSIGEDIASTEMNDTMMLYLAYRQIPNHEVYESNCNLFNNGSMQGIKCVNNNGIVPHAFKEETLQREVKKLFGEDTNIENKNIQLSNTCYGGFQYIKDRGEYVGGNCTSNISTIYKADKKLIEAYAYNDTIVLKEKVRYYGSENIDIDRLKDGVYVYTFKLDNNYNYVYVNKTLSN